MIFHLSYRSKYGDDVLFRTTVESSTDDKSGIRWKRIFSLKEAFPDAWFQLESGAADPTIRLTKRTFPFFVQSASGGFKLMLPLYGTNSLGTRSSQQWTGFITAAHKMGKEMMFGCWWVTI